jgi:hypothetical protein
MDVVVRNAEAIGKREGNRRSSEGCFEPFFALDDLHHEFRAS